MQLGNFVASSQYLNCWKQWWGIEMRYTANESQKTPEELSEQVPFSLSWTRCNGAMATPYITRPLTGVGPGTNLQDLSHHKCSTLEEFDIGVLYVSTKRTSIRSLLTCIEINSSSLPFDVCGNSIRVRKHERWRKLEEAIAATCARFCCLETGRCTWGDNGTIIQGIRH